MRGQRRARVRADSEEQRVAEGDQARVPEEEVQAEEGDGVGHERQHERRVVHGRDRRESQRDGERRGDEQEPPPPHAAATFPKIPRGRITSTPMTMR